jgi:hypothetical protein
MQLLMNFIIFLLMYFIIIFHVRRVPASAPNLHSLALPSPYTTPHRRAACPLLQNPDRGECVFSIVPPRACHHPERLNISRPSGTSFSTKPALPSPDTTPHRRAARPLRRNPDGGGCGFSIASPQGCHHADLHANGMPELGL